MLHPFVGWAPSSSCPVPYLAAAVQADQAERRSTWRLFLAPAAAAVLIAAVWAAGVWGTDGLRLGSLPGPISLRLGVPYASSACLSSNHSREVQKFVGKWSLAPPPQRTFLLCTSQRTLLPRLQAMRKPLATAPSHCWM